MNPTPNSAELAAREIAEYVLDHDGAYPEKIAAIISKHMQVKYERLQHEIDLLRAIKTPNGTAAKLVDYHEELTQLRQQLQEMKEHVELSDKEFLQLEDWLIGNAEIDLKLGLIDRATKCKERIRDLISREGEIGDLTNERDSLRQQNLMLVEALSLSIAYRKQQADDNGICVNPISIVAVIKAEERALSQSPDALKELELLQRKAKALEWIVEKLGHHLPREVYGTSVDGEVLDFVWENEQPLLEAIESAMKGK